MCCMVLFTISMAQPQIYKADPVTLKKEFSEKLYKKNFSESNFEQQIPEIPNPKSLVIPKQKTRSKSENWWEPDTVIAMIFNARTGKSYQIFDVVTYNTDWNLNTITRQIDGVNDVKWIYDYEHNNLKEEKSQTWNLGNWVNNISTNYRYDEHNNLIEQKTQHWRSGKWENVVMNSWKYENNILKEEFCLLWEWDEWDTIWQSNYDYDAHGNLRDCKTRGRIGGELVDNKWYHFEYDEINNLKYRIEYVSISNEWVHYVRFFYDYYEGTHNIEKDWVETWEGDEWLARTREVYHYDSNNENLLELLGQNWENNEWIDAQKLSLAYNVQNNFIEEAKWEELDTTNWVKSRRWTYLYEDNNLMEFIDEFGELNNWVTYKRTLYTYDENHNATDAIGQMWVNGEWVDDIAETMEIYYNNRQSYFSLVNPPEFCYFAHISYTNTPSLATNENLQNSNGTIKLYPNPTTGILYIETHENNLLPEIQIYSVQGTLLMSTKGNSIDISALSKGIYIANINGTVKKIVKQ